MVGDVSLRRLRRLWTLSRWPFTLYPASGVAAAFARITKDFLGRSDLEITTAVPLMYSSVVREGRELVNAAVAWGRRSG